MCGFFLSCVYFDYIKEVVEVELGMVFGGFGEGDGSLVNVFRDLLKEFL